MNKEEKQRTLRQNSALHLYFTLVADALNEAGLDIQEVTKNQMDIPWSEIMVKELIWKRAQKIHCEFESTTKLTTKDIDIIFDIVNRFLGEKMKIHIAFPSIEEIINKMRLEDE